MGFDCWFCGDKWRRYLICDGAPSNSSFRFFCWHSYHQAVPVVAVWNKEDADDMKDARVEERIGPPGELLFAEVADVPFGGTAWFSSYTPIPYCAAISGGYSITV